MNIKSKLALSLFAGASLLLGGNAIAGTTPGSLTTSASVVADCKITNGSVAFGSSDPTTVTGNTDFTGSFSIKCTNGSAVNIGLDGGLNSGGDVTARAMSDGSGHLLNYSLSTNAPGGQNWGNTPLTDTVDFTADGTTQTQNVYGRIPLQATAYKGSYSDTIVITATFN